MKRYFRIALLFLALKGHASHIAGGEMIYDYLGNNMYRVTLKIYRDCSLPTNPDFDGIGNTAPAILSVIDANGVGVGTYDLGIPVVTKVPPAINSPCIQAPNTVCIEEGVYTYTLTLPPKAGGYYLIYQRCCRNIATVNLINSSNTGATYYAQIPGPETVAANSSPSFKNFPPIFLCNNVAFSFDHAAVDPDGDQLVYSLCAPYQGLDACCPEIVPAGFPPPKCNPGGCSSEATPPPYSPLVYVAPYSGSYPIASSPSFAINPATGMFSGTPNLIGQFVVGICVREFRNNVLVGEHQRDFQFNVVPCVISVVSAVADQKNQCVGSTISFVNLSTSNVGPLTYAWDFGVSGSSTDTSSAINPTYTYQDTGKFTLTLIANPGKQCSDTLKKQIYVYPPLSVSFAPQPSQCFKNNSFSFTTQGLYAPQAVFSWSFGAFASPGASTAKSPSNVTFTQGGTFPVKLLATQFACRDSFTDNIHVFHPTLAKVALPESLCDPAQVTFVNQSTSDFPLSYQWKFSNGTQSTDVEPSGLFTPAGPYTADLTAISRGTCADTSNTSLNFNVNPLPLSGFSCSPETASIFDSEITITNHSGPDVFYWQYDFGDGARSQQPDLIHIYQKYGDFVITQTVTSAYNCVSTSQQKVKILPEYRFWIPNSFTPDNNSLNDIFMPIAIGVQDYEFEIFDRWGKKMFDTDQVSQGWNGKYNGEGCPQDVYIWRVTFRNVTTKDRETHCGTVLVLREQ